MVLCIASFVALVVAEIVVRLMADELLPNAIGPRYLYQADDILGIDHAPGFRGRFNMFDEFDVAIEINSKGLRDHEFGPKKSATTRILSLGDSFGFGYGVEAEETYAKVLEHRLNAVGSAEFEVMNASASARGIRHMIEILERHGPGFKPDVVIASFFYVNDLIDIKNFPEHTVRGGIVMTAGIGGVVDQDSWLHFGVYYSDLALLVWRAKFNMERRAMGQAFQLGVMHPDGRTWSTEMLLAKPDPKNQAELAVMADRAELWKQFEVLLATLKALTEKLGAKLVLFSIPQATQTRSEVWARDVADGVVSEGKFDRDLISKMLTGICQRSEVRFLDLVTGFRATKPTGTRFFPVNRHFNVEGHAVAAKLLEEYLRKEKLL